MDDFFLFWTPICLYRVRGRVLTSSPNLTKRPLLDTYDPPLAFLMVQHPSETQLRNSKRKRLFFIFGRLQRVRRGLAKSHQHPYCMSVTRSSHFAYRGNYSTDGTWPCSIRACTYRVAAFIESQMRSGLVQDSFLFKTDQSKLVA